MPWILYEVLAAATHNVIDSSRAIVSCDLQKLNEARVICSHSNVSGPVDNDTEVQIIDQVVDPVTKLVTEEHVLIHGYVEKYAQMTKGAINSTYEYTIKELAGELEKYRVHVTGTSNYIVTCPAQNTSAYAASILVETTWSAATAMTNYLVDALQFRYMTALAGLNKIVSQLSAATAATPLYMWFDSDLKTVGWGTSRNDRTSVNFIKGLYYDYKEEKTIRNQVNGVVIFGANSAYSGQYPAVPTGHNLAVYQYDDANTDAECEQIATAVYLTWCNDPKRRIQFKVRPIDTKVAGSYVLEGDRIQVDGVNYTVIDMTYTPKDILIGVNAGEDSVLYSLGDKLKPVAGTASGALNQSWDPGTQNVSSDGTTKTVFTYQLADNTKLGDDWLLDCTIGTYKAQSYQVTAAVANELLSNVLVPSSFDGLSYPGDLWNAATTYLPFTSGTPELVAGSEIENGFEYAFATVSFTTEPILATVDIGYLYVTCEYNYTGATTGWFEGTFQQKWRIPTGPDGERTFCTNTYLIPGTANTCQPHVRWKCLAEIGVNDVAAGVHYYLRNISCMLDVIPRHTHDWQQTGVTNANELLAPQTDDVTEVETTPPASVTVYVNGTNLGSLTPGVPKDIKSYLIDGINDISFTSDTVCTVTPSGKFIMYG